MNFYKHHLGDYDGHTAHLSWDEDMAYTRLLRAYYRREAPITAAEAYRLARASTRAQRQAVDAVLAEFFTQQADGWHNKRADEEIGAYLSKASANRENGKLGGRPKPKKNPRCNPNGSQGEPTNNLSQKPDTKNQKPEKEKASAQARETPIPEGFAVSERVKTWAVGKGYAQLERYLEFFVGRMKANGKRYTDWDEALMNCIREDWPKFRQSTVPDYTEVIANLKD